MESPLSDSFTFPGNRLTTYLQTLAATKKGLPHGIPVCVCTSHTITTTNALIQVASSIGPHIAILEIIADIIDDWSDETVQQLLALAKQHAFLIWEGGRILNSTVDVTGKQTETKEVRNELVDLVRKKYTKGVVKAASWAGVATAWASGVREENQEVDILIPALKAAARETVANTMQTIRTEITAEKSSAERPFDNGFENGLTEDSGSQHLTSDYVVVDDEGLGPPLRKASTISLTQTITQHTEDSTDVLSVKSEKSEGTDHLEVANGQKRPSITLENDDELPPPPLLARGLVLCLPSENTDAFTSNYRRSCIAAARANQDFVIGFLTSGQWHVVSQRDNLLDIDTPVPHGDGTKRRRQEKLATDWDEDKPYHLAVFSVISHQLSHINGKHISNHGEESCEENDEPLSPTAHVVVDTSSTDESNPLASKLDSIVGRALKLREASSNGEMDELPSNNTRRGPRIMHVPIVSLP